MPGFETSRRVFAAALMTVAALCGFTEAHSAEEGTLTVLDVEGDTGVFAARVQDLESSVRGFLTQLPFKYRDFEATSDSVAVTLAKPDQAVLFSQIVAGVNLPRAHVARDGEFQPFQIDVSPEGRVTFRSTDALREDAADEATIRAARIVRARLTEADTDYTVVPRRDGRIAVWTAEPADVAKLQAGAHFGIHAVDGEANTDLLSAVSKSGFTLMSSPGADGQLWMVRKKAIVSQDDLLDVWPIDEAQGEQSSLGFQLDESGRKRLGDWTTENVGETLAVVLDDTVVSAPVVREPLINGYIQMATGLPADELDLLAGRLDPLSRRLSFVAKATCEAGRPRAPPLGTLIKADALRCH